MRYARRTVALVRLVLYTLYELLLANGRVTMDVLRSVDRLRPQVIRVPVDHLSAAEITALANLITLTPGSLAVDVEDDLSALHVHVMNLRDEDAEREQIRTGFERRVREVFR